MYGLTCTDKIKILTQEVRLSFWLFKDKCVTRKITSGNVMEINPQKCFVSQLLSN